LPDQAHRDLAAYRLENARTMLADARTLADAGSYKSGNNRAYYAIFHAVRALLALEGLDFKKHSAVIAHFQNQYVRTGIFDKEYSSILAKASTIRNDSDYNDFFIASREDTLKQIDNADKFIRAIEEYMSRI